MPIQIKCLDKFGPLITTPKRIKILVGGRASTKSTFAADYVLAKLREGEIWCCAREYLNSIEESVHRLMMDEIERLEMEGFTEKNNAVQHASGGRAFHKGLARNITSLKSTLSGIGGLWIEEGESLSEKTLRVLTASVRASAKDAQALLDAEEFDESLIDVPEIWITMNRGSRNDPIAKKYLARAEQDLARHSFYEDDTVMIVQANYTDMPRKWFLASGLEQERKDDEERMTHEQYSHKWMGDYLETVANAIIRPEWFDACVDAHIKLNFKPLGMDVVSLDPSDEGEDPSALAHRHGCVFKQVMEFDPKDVNVACDVATDYAVNHHADVFTWDGDGLGATLKRQIGQAFEGKTIRVEMFNGGGGVDYPERIYEPTDTDVKNPKSNREAFFNKRSQYYGLLRDRMYRTFRAVTHKEYFNPDEMVSFSSEIERLDLLKSEICRIPKKDNGSGRFQILSKKEMRALDIPSPNMADAVMMNIAVSAVAKQKKKSTHVPQAFSAFR